MEIPHAAAPDRKPSRSLLACELRPRRLQLVLTDQETSAAQCVIEAGPCWEEVEGCSIEDVHRRRRTLAKLQGPLITVSPLQFYVLLEDDAYARPVSVSASSFPLWASVCAATHSFDLFGRVSLCLTNL